MQNLLVTGYPRGQTYFRRRVSDLTTRWLTRRSTADRTIDLGIGGLASGDSELFDALPDDTVLRAENEAFIAASTWYIRNGQDITETSIGSLGKAIEAELFRILKEFAIALRVGETIIKTFVPSRCIFIDTAMADILKDSTGACRVESAFSYQSLDTAADWLRLARDVRPWTVSPSDVERLQHGRVLFFSDNPSHARTLAPLASAMVTESPLVIDPNPTSQTVYARHNLNPIVPERKIRASLLTNISASTWQKWHAHLISCAGHQELHLLKPAWVRRQIGLLLMRSSAWLPLWNKALPEVSGLSVTALGIWPRFRLFLSASKNRGRKTAIAMHGNIPDYKAYYGKPAPDVYGVYGDLFKQHLSSAGVPETAIHIIGRPDNPAQPKTTSSKHKTSTPHVLFLQQTFGSELSWFEYAMAVHAFCQVARQRPTWHFTVKLHPFPQNDGAEFRQCIEIMGLRNLDIVKDRSIPQCLAESDVAVALFSTTILDALQAQVPVVTMNFSGRSDLMPFAEFGLAKRVTHPDDLISGVESAISDPVPEWPSSLTRRFVEKEGRSAMEASLTMLQNLYPGKQD